MKRQQDAEMAAEENKIKDIEKDVGQQTKTLMQLKEEEKKRRDQVSRQADEIKKRQDEI